MTHTKDKAKAATPHHDLIAELLNPNIPKNEREHAAVREIERLQALAAPVQKRPPNCGTGYCSCIECVMEPAPVPLTDDTRRLDALAKNSWDLRCFDMSSEDIGWRVIEHHMAKPHERTVAEVFRDDPRQAIDAAMRAAHGITKGQP
jgi:hypothetical protein